MAFPYIILPAVLLAILSARVILNWHKLRKAPGPTLAGFTDLWRAYHLYNGTLSEKLLKLHARHGPIVRYGVRSISISDPEVINVVYGSRAGFIPAESYDVLLGHQNGKNIASLVSTRNEKQHGALRRSVAGAFTPTATLDYEKWIDITTEELLETVSKKSTFDLSSMFLWYTMDAAARFSFGESLGCLTAEDDVNGSVQMIRDRLGHWARWSSYPRIESLVFRNPIFKRAMHGPSTMAAAAMAKLRARANGGGALKEKKEIAIAPDLLERFIEAREDFPGVLDDPGIVGMLMSTISGAGDTTASTVAAMFFHLLHNPAVLNKLEAELTDANIDEIPTFTEVNKLPYLNAVLRETMRVFSIMSFPLERLVPAGGAVIAGMYFPEGTSVGCLPSAVHLDKKVFGEDVDVFRPERWLEGDREQLRLMEAAHMGFSRGRKNCLGQNIAVMSIKKAVSALLMKFKFSLVDPNAPFLTDCTSAAATAEPIYVHSVHKC